MRKFERLFSNLMPWKTERKTKFRPGDRVRILSYEKIKKTLDGRNRFENLMFAESMAKFCGGDYEVLREVKWVYDECSMKMLRCKDIVVLKDLICDGKGILNGRDCDRTCPYYWKKIWLEEA